LNICLPQIIKSKNNDGGGRSLARAEVPELAVPERTCQACLKPAGSDASKRHLPSTAPCSLSGRKGRRSLVIFPPEKRPFLHGFFGAPCVSTRFGGRSLGSCSTISAILHARAPRSIDRSYVPLLGAGLQAKVFGITSLKSDLGGRV